MQYVEKISNGLKVVKSINNYEFQLQYKPVEYVALLELGRNDFTRTELEEMKKKFGSQLYFTLNIRNKNSSDELFKDLGKTEEEKEKYLNYFSFELQNRLKLVSDKDTADCILYHYERNFSVSPENKIVLGFENNEFNGSKNKDINIDLQDTALKCGDVTFTVQANALDDIPSLKTNN
jgi:hypothetical protein